MTKQQEEQVKLHILISLARSQRALARILESTANTAAGYPHAAEKLMEHAGSISEYQRMLASRIAGIKHRTLRRSKPGKLWIAGKVRTFRS